MSGANGLVRVCLYGLGGIGAAVGRALIAGGSARVVGAVEADRAKVGRDLHSVLRIRGRSGVLVSDEPAGTLRDSKPDVVVHCTGSSLEQVAPQLEEIVVRRVPCVSSCEEMAFPEAAGSELAARLDRAARAGGVALVGAGVNPGFVMDALVLALSGACRTVTHVGVERVLDPLSRRKAFRKKVGIGLTHRQAARQIEKGKIGHVGLRHSALLVAKGLGWTITKIEEDLRLLYEGQAPARRSRRPPDPEAAVTGVHQTLSAGDGKKELIRMEMLMEAGVEAPHDAVTISGIPDLSLWIRGGIPGDEATVSCLINGMHHVLSPPRAGLLTLLDLPLRAPGGPVERTT